MKIGIDGRVLMDKHYSGVSYYGHNLIKALVARNKHSYSLFYNSFHKLDESLLSLAPYKISRIPNKIFNYILQLFLAYPKTDKYLGGVDIMLAPHINFLSWSSDTKKILVIHDLSFLRQKNFFSWRKNIWHKLLGVEKLVSQADAIIAVSYSTKREIVELLKVPESKVFVIHSGIDAPKLNESDLNRVNNVYDLPENYLLYLGNIEPRKNIVNLIKAFELLKEKPKFAEYQLILGGSWAWKISEIKDAWLKSKFKADIRFLGYIKHSDKAALYSLAKAFIYPSYYEGFGFPPLEAMAYGCPVVASNLSSLPEILSEASLYVNPFDYKDMAKIISELLEDKDLYNLMKEKGFSRVKDFSWDKTAEAYENLFNDLYEKNSKKESLSSPVRRCR